MLTRQQRLEAYKQEVNKRMVSADRALRQPDAKGYSGKVEREYQRELARHLIKGGRGAATSQTDQRIAGKLKAAGFNEQEIRRAIQKHSPMAVKANQQQSQDYAARIVKNASKIKRQEIHSADERRLDKVDLAEKTGISSKQEARVNRWKATQEYAAKKGPNHPYTQAQRFRLLKAQQLDKHGAKIATNPRADIDAAKVMNGKYNDSVPQNKEFGRAIGRNSASVVVNKPVKTREAYGAGMARKASKPSGGNGNTRPERQKAPTHDAQVAALYYQQKRSR